jgi:hypothetical protein
VKLVPPLVPAEVVTTIPPLSAPVGTCTFTAVELHDVIVMAVEPIFTEPWVLPKFIPVSATPTRAGPCSRDVVGAIVNVAGGLFRRAAVETTTGLGPAGKPAGTTTPIVVSLQELIEAFVELNLTVPCAEPKPDPLMVIMWLSRSDAGERLLI